MDDWKTRHLFPAFGMVPIQRDKARASMAALTTAADLLAEGRLVGIYPEGTRSRDHLLHRGHSGVAHLAMTTGAPIVPVGLVGTREIQPIGKPTPQLRGNLEVRFGEPIHPSAYQAGGRRRQRQQMTDDVMASIATMTNQLRSPDFTSGEAPLVRGGSESVYEVRRLRGAGAGWGPAANGVVAAACNRWDDARIGEVGNLMCRPQPDGSMSFDIELKISTRFQGAPS